MSASFYDLMRYAKTGVASSDMTHYDKQKALAFFGGSYPVTTITGLSPLSYLSDGKLLTAWSIKANMVQDGTPTPDAQVVPQEFGDFVESGEHAGQYAVQITNAGNTYNIYVTEPLRKIGDYADTISSDGTVTRCIKKLVLTGQENWSITSNNRLRIGLSGQFKPYDLICSHYKSSMATAWIDLPDKSVTVSISGYLAIHDTSYDNTTDFKAYLAAQYTAGTPVTVWYVLATPTTESVSAPTIQTAKGANTLTVGTTLPPSEVSITGNIKAS